MYNLIFMMSTKILEADGLIFWFHSHDALHEKRASVHVGKGRQDDVNDAKIWLEPELEVHRAGYTLKPGELRKVLRAIEENRAFLLEEWNGYGK
jgi:hypothetical protein